MVEIGRGQLGLPVFSRAGLNLFVLEWTLLSAAFLSRETRMHEEDQQKDGLFPDSNETPLDMVLVRCRRGCINTTDSAADLKKR